MLDRLKDYKEFILILMLFSSGVVWIYGIFATKSKLEQVHCLLDANIELLSNQLQSKILLDEIALMARDLQALDKRKWSGDEYKKEARMKLLSSNLDEARKKELAAIELVLRDRCRER